MRSRLRHFSLKHLQATSGMPCKAASKRLAHGLVNLQKLQVHLDSTVTTAQGTTHLPYTCLYLLELGVRSLSKSRSLAYPSKGGSVAVASRTAQDQSFCLEPGLWHPASAEKDSSWRAEPTEPCGASGDLRYGCGPEQTRDGRGGPSICLAWMVCHSSCFRVPTWPMQRNPVQEDEEDAARKPKPTQTRIPASPSQTSSSLAMLDWRSDWHRMSLSVST